MTTPEGKVKHEVKKFLTEEGLIRAGEKRIDYPPEVLGWYYMPSANGLGVAGIPDFIICYKGFFVAIETKAEGKLASLTDNQRQRIHEIVSAWGTVFVIDDIDHLRRKWKNWKLLLGERHA